ncbi:MAG: LolA family protein [Acidobacteriota bacterium]
MKIIITMTLGLLLILPSLPQSAKEIASRVENKLRSLTTLEANFEQIYISASVSSDLKEKGRFFYGKPGLMRWEYSGPEERIYLIKDSLLWEYILGEKQLIKYDLSSEDKDYQAEVLALLSGNFGIGSRYTVAFSPVQPEKDKTDSLFLELQPIEEGDYESIWLWIDTQNYLVRQILFTDWAGNKTEFTFTNIKTNRPLREKIFELDISSDVEIIEYKK